MKASRLVIDLARGAFLDDHRRGLLGVDEREPEGVDRVERGQHDAGQKRRLKERTDRHDRGLAQKRQRVAAADKLGARFLGRGIDVAGQRAQKDDDDRGRDDLAERPEAAITPVASSGE